MISRAEIILQDRIKQAMFYLEQSKKQEHLQEMHWMLRGTIVFTRSIYHTAENLRDSSELEGEWLEGVVEKLGSDWIIMKDWRDAEIKKRYSSW